MKKKLLVVFLVLFAVGLYLYSNYGYLIQSARNFPKPTKNIENSTSLPTPTTSDEELSYITLPDDFAITYFASDVPGARSLTISDTGVVYVGTRSDGVVYALVDEDSDFRADKRYVIASGLNSPNGVAYKDGDLYVAEISRIIKFENIDNTYSQSPDFEVVYDDYPTDTHHGWKYISFGPDGNLYVPVGAPCNICDPEDPYASLTRLNLETGEMNVIARGIRNTVGFDWHPETEGLWFSDNGRDWLGDNQPPDELNQLSKEGDHFGYPYCHGEGINDPEFGEGVDCSQYNSPYRELGPHVAALGIEFYESNLYPEEYKDKVFIAEHGSWNREVPIGYRITTVSLNTDSPEYETFASGWLDETGEAKGRPVDILELSDGSLLISDDKSGSIYRITYNKKSE